MTTKAAAALDPLDLAPSPAGSLPYELAANDMTAPAPVHNRAEEKAPRRFGKRKLADAREHFVAVRCNAPEHATMTAKASAAGLSVGAYLRTLAIGAAGPRAVRRRPVEKEELARLLGEIGKLGSNVNQIARVVNTTGNLPASRDLATLTAEVQTMRAALMKALGRGD